LTTPIIIAVLALLIGLLIGFTAGILTCAMLLFKKEIKAARAVIRMMN
jgi:hypothetical protein